MIGDALAAQGNFDEALKNYQHSLGIIEPLAASDSSNVDLQRSLSASYDRIGDALAAQSNFDEAIKNYRHSLGIIEPLAASDRSNTLWQNNLEYSALRIGGLAYKFVLAGSFGKALEASDQAISLAPSEIWLKGNRAHALMFLGRVDEARVLYLRYRGERDAQNGKPWEAVVLEDFAELRKAGLSHALMDEIEKRFAGGGQN